MRIKPIIRSAWKTLEGIPSTLWDYFWKLLVAIGGSRSVAHEFLKEYLTLVGGFTLVWGLIINSPDWPKTVRIEPLNPFVMTNAGKFYEQAKAYGIGEDAFKGMIPAGTSFDPKEANQRYFLYQLPWYYPCTETKGPAQKPIDKLPDDWVLNHRLVDTKTQLGYKDDPDLRLPLVGHTVLLFRDLSLRVLHERPEQIWSDLYMSNASTSIVPTTADFFKCDPFHQLFDAQVDKWERVRRYEALLKSSEFISGFVVRNDHWRTASNVKLVVNVPPQVKWSFVDKSLAAANIAIAEKHDDIVRLEIGAIRPGDDQYKLLLLRSPDTPINRDYLYLLDQGLVKEIGEYWRWLLGLPLVLLIGWKYLEWLTAENESTKKGSA